MKRLLLMRHGKATWKDLKKDEDQLRPLTKKGEKDVKIMAELLEEKGMTPQIILTSTARRARETANVFLAHCCEEITITALEGLYMAEAPAIITALQTVPDSVDRVMVIGHNPGLEGLLQLFTGRVESLQTASIGYLELPIEQWSHLSSETMPNTWEKWKPKDA